MKNIFLYLVFIAFYIMGQSHPVSAQSRSGAQEDINELLSGAEQQRISRNFDKSIALIEEASKISDKIGDKNSKAKAMALLTMIYCALDNFPLAKSVIDKNFTENAFYSATAKAYCHFSKAHFENFFDNNAEVFKNVDEALLQLTNIDDFWIKSKLYYLQYQVYASMNNWDKAETSAQKSLEFSYQNHDFNQVSHALAGIATTYEHRYQETKNPAYWAKAEQFLLKAYRLYNEKKGLVSDYIQAIVGNNLANLYSYNPNKITEKELNKILEETEKLASKIGKQQVIGTIFGIKSKLALSKNNAVLAEKNLLEGYRIIQNLKNPDQYILSTFASELSRFYEEKNNLKAALMYQKFLLKHKDSLAKQQETESIRKLEVMHQIKESEKQLADLKQTNKNKQMLIYLYLGISLLALIGLFFMWRAKIFKEKYAQNRELFFEKEREDAEIKREHAELQIKFEKEENARILIEKQLAELEKSNLQKALLAGTLQVEHKNKLLKNIEKKIAQGEKINVKKVINKELISDRNFENIKKKIEHIHPDFFNALQAKTAEKLSPLDKKICSFILLDMDTKEMAQLLNIDPKSVRMSKYRVKQKIGLGKESDLDEFLKNLG